ncbi:hypothetical protein [Chitinophaga sp. 212800010-3]|uniref:hypothetical protein n=1 Tax=unclassified Chitinophaga TaxID=2619133 RepID=UPI002DF175FC|nr:hypothetical protein [Chitinophaga sp. 212800010-3]
MSVDQPTHPRPPDDVLTDRAITLIEKEYSTKVASASVVSGQVHCKTAFLTLIVYWDSSVGCAWHYTKDGRYVSIYVEQ